jgi:hypothetical protein
MPNPTTITTYTIRITASYYSSFYINTAYTFTLTVLSYCSITALTIPTIATQYYNILDSAMTFGFTSTTFPLECYPAVALTVTLTNERTVPTFISYSGTITFSVYSETIGDKGTFSILITGTSGASTATTTF